MGNDTRTRVLSEARRLIAMGGVETRGRKPKDHDTHLQLPPGAIPWNVINQAFRNLYPRGAGRGTESGSINETDVLEPMRREWAQGRVVTRKRKNLQQGDEAYPHLLRGAETVHRERSAFLAKVQACMAEVQTNGTRVSTKSVQLALSRRGIERGTTTTQRAIKQIRQGLPVK